MYLLADAFSPPAPLLDWFFPKACSLSSCPQSTYVHAVFNHITSCNPSVCFYPPKILGSILFCPATSKPRIFSSLLTIKLNDSLCKRVSIKTSGLSRAIVFISKAEDKFWWINMYVMLLLSHWAELGLAVSFVPPPFSVQSFCRGMGEKGGINCSALAHLPLFTKWHLFRKPLELYYQRGSVN